MGDESVMNNAGVKSLQATHVPIIQRFSNVLGHAFAMLIRLFSSGVIQNFDVH